MKLKKTGEMNHFMIKAPLCQKCGTPLYTRQGKTGLCRTCALKNSNKKLVDWTPKELQLIDTNVKMKRQIEWNKQIILKRHTKSSYETKLCLLRTSPQVIIQKSEGTTWIDKTLKKLRKDEFKQCDN